MSQLVYEFSPNMIQKMQHYYKNSLVNQPQGAVFRAKTRDAVITAYRSGKVLFQGSAPAMEANKWVAQRIDEQNEQTTSQTQASPYMPPSTLFSASHLGSDEAGTGDYFGPMTVASTYVCAEHIQLLKQIGVKDSKAFTDETILRLSKEIIALNIPYSLLILPNEKYNSLQQKGWSQGKMKTLLHHYVNKNVLKKIGNQPYQGIVIDQFCQPNVFKRHLASEQETMLDNTYFITKAEQYSIAVAAASILARASFLEKMNELSLQIGIQLPKGASQKVDQTIATIMKKHGERALYSVAKVHFANSKKAKKYL
ncbi:MAG TPA: ribonuclease HIII [Bacillota bacterium]